VNELNPNDFVITRKRKKYKFALFNNYPICFEEAEWSKRQKCNIIELGAGTGLFSLSLAKLYPKKSVVAIDIKGDRLQTGAKLAIDNNIQNIKFLRVRADQLIDLIKLKSLDGIWLTFSDPYPKKRSSGRRLTSPHYLEIYKKLLKNNGNIFFKTDSKVFFEWSLEQFAKEKLVIRDITFNLHNSDLPAEYKTMTAYERKFVNQGMAIMFAKVSKK
jgi:tRNA (guanine-N7-)-methyltransferase